MNMLSVKSLALLLSVVFAQGQLPQFTTTPDNIIEGAPFRITTTSNLINSVFISRTVDCTSVASGGSTVPLVSGSATFTISSDPDTVVFLCDAASNIVLRSLEMNPITYEPQFLFRATPSLLTFSPVTPAFSRVQLRSYGDCTTGVADFDGTVSSNRSVTVTMESAVYYFVCVQFSSTVTGQVVTLNAGNVLVTEAVQFTPQSGIRGDTAIFELSGAAPPFTNVIISSTTDCKTSIAGPLAATGTFGKTVATTLTMTRGSWDFCVETPLNSNIFVSAGKLQVREYGLTPRTIFQGRPTSLSLTLDSPTNTDVVLTQSSNCLPPFVAGPTVPSGGSFTWTLSLVTGSYVACVKKSSLSTDYVIAGEINLVQSYTVTVGSIPSVVGVPNALSVSPNPMTRVIMSATPDCSTPRVDVVTTSSQAQFVVASASPDVLTICTYTLDNTGLYSVGTLTVRPFQLFFAPTLAGVPNTFTLDASAPVTSNFRFASFPNCTSSLVDLTVPVSKTITTAIPTAGISYACLEAIGTYRAVTSFQTNPMPNLSPGDAIQGISTSLMLQNPTGGVEWRIGRNCSDVLQSSTTEFVGNSSMNVLFSQDGEYSSCLGLLDSQGSVQFIEIGRTTVHRITSMPPIHATSKPSAIRFLNIPESLDHLFVASVMFLVEASQLCPPSPSNIFPTFELRKIVGSQNYYQATFIQNTSGSFKVCITLSEQVLHTSTISVIVPINTTYTDSVLLLNVPFAFTVNDPYIPTRYDIVASTDDCSAASVVSGNFRVPSGSSESISIDSVGMYALCISSFDGTTMLWNDLVIIDQFIPETTSLIRTIPNTLMTSPALPGFSLFISPLESCGGTTYSSDETNALLAPTGSYFMCATQGTGWNTVGRPGVQVLDPFIGQVPSLVRVNVSFNVSVEGGDVVSTPFTKLCVSASTNCNCAEEGVTIFETNQNATDFSSRRFGRVTVTSPRFELRYVCALSFDETAGMPLASIVPQPYMNPFSIAKGSFQWLMSGAVETGYAVITRFDSCASPLSSVVAIRDFNASQLFVAESITVDSAFYCEGLFPTGPFINRGPLALLGPFDPNATSPTPAPGLTPNPPDNETFINITDGKITISAATPFKLNLPPSAGSNPFVSRSSDCLNKISTAEEFGIFPVEGGQSEFFICATSPDGSTLFTNPEPSLVVQGFSSNVPSLQRGKPTRLVLSPSSGLQRATNNRFFLSRTSACTEAIEDASGMTLDDLVVFEHSGLVFVCVSVGNVNYGIKSLAVFEAPVVVNSSTAVRGFPVCSTIRLEDLNYSLSFGADASFSLSSYFMSTNRTTYLSSDLEGCSFSNSPQTAAVFLGSDAISSSWSVCHDTSMIVDVSVLYTICIGTPVGLTPGTQSAESTRLSHGTHLSFKEGVPSPVNHVAGVLSPFSLALLPSTNFHLTTSDLDCSQPVGPTFFTGSTGSGFLLSTEIESPKALASGSYVLCALHQSTWWPISAINLFPQQVFGVSNNVLVAGSTTTLDLLGDLTSDAVYGLAFDGLSCADATNMSDAATLTRPTAKTIAISGQMDFTSAVLCARAAVNETLFAIDLIRFIANPIQFPASVPACVDFTLGFSYIEDAKADTELYLYQDPCCLSQYRPERIVSTSNIIPTQETLRTMQVPRSKILEIAPQVSFNLCLRNTTMCLDVGTIAMDDLSRCDLTLIPEASRPLSQARFVGGAAPQASDENRGDTIWIVVVFFFVLLLIILVVILYAKMRSSKVVPEDVDPQTDDNGAEESVSWKKAFDTMFMDSSKGTAQRDPRNVQSILHVPIDMNLDICREMPLENQALVTEEEEERDKLLDDEAFCYQQILDSWTLGLSDAQANSSIHQRTQLLRHVLSIHERELGAVEDEEADSRYTVSIEEEQVRLAIAESERQAWRIRMQQDSQRLQEENISSVNFRSRTRRLQDGSSKMFHHLDAAAPALRSPARSRVHQVESFLDPNLVPLSPHPVSNQRHLDASVTTTTATTGNTREKGVVFSPIDENQGRYAPSLRELGELRTSGGNQSLPQEHFSFTDGATPSRRHRSRYTLE